MPSGFLVTKSYQNSSSFISVMMYTSWSGLQAKRLLQLFYNIQLNSQLLPRLWCTLFSVLVLETKTRLAFHSKISSHKKFHEQLFSSETSVKRQKCFISINYCMLLIVKIAFLQYPSFIYLFTPETKNHEEKISSVF